MTSNTAPYGVAACSSYFDNAAQHNAWHAFDGVTNMSWSSTRYPSYPQWLSYDFGAGNKAFVNRFSIYGRYSEDVYRKSQWVKSMKLQYSDDLTNWFDAYVNNNVPQYYPLEEYIQVQEKHRAWRILILSVQGNTYDGQGNVNSTGVGISSFQLYGHM